MFGKKFKAGKYVTLQPAQLGKRGEYSVLTLRGRRKWDTVFTGGRSEAKRIARAFKSSGFKQTSSLGRIDRRSAK